MGYKAYSITLNIVDDSGNDLSTGATVIAQAGTSSKTLAINSTTSWQTTTTATTLTLTASVLTGYSFSLWAVSWPYVIGQTWRSSTSTANPETFTLTTAVQTTIPVTLTLTLTKSETPTPEPDPTDYPVLTYSAEDAISGVPEAETFASGVPRRISRLIPQYKQLDGYIIEFLRWYDETAGKYYPPFSEITLTSDKTLTAEVNSSSKSSKSMTYVFDGNGGTGTPDPITCNDNGYLRIPSDPIPTKSGCGFIGYAEKAEGTSYVLVPFSLYKYSSSKSKYTLYAIWEERGAQYTYDDNGGSGGPGDVAAAIGEWTFVADTKPTRDGYTFLSWNDNVSGYGTSYSAGDLIMITAGLVLYAQWKKDAEPEPGPGPSPTPTPGTATGLMVRSASSDFLVFSASSGALVYDA